jgi:hypothetical protein
MCVWATNSLVAILSDILVLGMELRFPFDFVLAIEISNLLVAQYAA